MAASDMAARRRRRRRRVVVALRLRLVVAGSPSSAVLRRSVGSGLFLASSSSFSLPRRPRSASAPRLRRRVRLGVRTAAVGGVQVDDVAQQDAPPSISASRQIDDGADGQRAFADAADHHLAAGLDPLGDGDLALAGQQLDRAHFAQVHAHRIVGAADVVVVEVAGGLGRRRRLLVVGRRSPRAPRSRSTLMPISESIAMVSSICSEDTWSCGSTSFSSS